MIICVQHIVKDTKNLGTHLIHWQNPSSWICDQVEPIFLFIVFGIHLVHENNYTSISFYRALIGSMMLCTRLLSSTDCHSVGMWRLSIAAKWCDTELWNGLIIDAGIWNLQ